MHTACLEVIHNIGLWREQRPVHYVICMGKICFGWVEISLDGRMVER